MDYDIITVMKYKDCLHCGNKFNTYRPYKVKLKKGYKTYFQKKSDKFCSQKCYHSNAKGKPLMGYNLVRSRQDIKKAILARKNNPEVRSRWIAKMKEVTLGSKNPAWVSDRSKLVNQDERNCFDYVQWAKSVRIRDEYKCRIFNKDCKGRIEVHHILSYREYPELRYQINNGVTLCHAHHPRVKSEEKRLIPFFQELVSVSSKIF